MDESNTASKEMTGVDDRQITLTLKGARAERGVSLSHFESFIDNFLAALRYYDRAGRGEPPGSRATPIDAQRP